MVKLNGNLDLSRAALHRSLIAARDPNLPPEQVLQRLVEQQGTASAQAARTAQVAVPDSLLQHFENGQALPQLDIVSQFMALLESLFTGNPFPTENGRTIVGGGNEADQIEIRPGPGGGAYVTVNGETSYLTAEQAKNLTIRGGAGNDRLLVDPSYTGSVRVEGGVGDDVIQGGRGDDVLLGAEGNDRILGGRGNDVIVGGAGNDDLQGGTGDDRVSGGRGHDKVRGGTGNDFLLGGAGNDDVRGGNGDDKVRGGSGIDRVAGDAGRDQVTAGGDDGVIFDAIHSIDPGLRFHPSAAQASGATSESQR